VEHAGEKNSPGRATMVSLLSRLEERLNNVYDHWLPTAAGPGPKARHMSLAGAGCGYWRPRTSNIYLHWDPYQDVF